MEILSSEKHEENSVTSPTMEYPTLIPQDSFEKIKNSGRIKLESVNTIRDWRKRLYKAFKNKSKISRIIRKSPGGVIDNTDDPSTFSFRQDRRPLSIKNPSWLPVSDQKQLFGIESLGKQAGFVDQSSLLLSPPKETRLVYRSSNRQPVVFVPATNQEPEIVPVPASAYLVTAQPPQRNVQLNILPPLPNNQVNFAYSTFSPNEDNSISNKECNGQCGSGPPEVEGDKCNSERLRNIISNNIVNGDAEASKRAVQSAAEAETGLFFDAVCGTGFFSYIAHTDEFCLASSGGVNCYVFAPVCQEANSRRKSKKYNRNLT